MPRDLTSSKRLIEVVLDTGSDPPVYRDAHIILDQLTDVELDRVRRTQTDAMSSGATRYRCPQCDGRLYIRNSPQQLLHFYHARGDGQGCPWHEAKGSSPERIDAKRFDGAQESEAHNKIKNWLAAALSVDPEFSEVMVEAVIGRRDDNDKFVYRKPDVSAEFRGEPIAFDIQLSSTHVSYIAERERFYQKFGIRYVWVVDARSTALWRQAFKDIYLSNNGEVFAVDEKCVQESCDAGQLVLRSRQLVPGPAKRGFAPEWKTFTVTRDAINWGSSGAIPSARNIEYDRYLFDVSLSASGLRRLRTAFLHSLQRGDAGEAAYKWNTVAKICGGARWHQLPSGSEPHIALGVIATVASRTEVYVQTKHAIDDIVAIVNSMLLEPPARRTWTHLFETVARAAWPTLLETPSIHRKVQRNRDELYYDLLTEVRGVFDALIPRGAFERMVIAQPKEFDKDLCPF